MLPKETGGEELSGKKRQSWLASIFDRVVIKGCSPQVAAKFPLEVLREAGVTDDILKSLGLLSVKGDSLPQYCTLSQFEKILFTELQINRSRKKLSELSLRGYLKPARTANGSLHTMQAINIFREQVGNGESAPKDGGETEGEIKRDRERIKREKEQIELDEMKRISSADWMLSSVHLLEMRALGTVVHNVGRDILERQLNRPELFDQFQNEIGLKIDELIAEAKTENRRLKAERK